MVKGFQDGKELGHKGIFFYNLIGTPGVDQPNTLSSISPFCRRIKKLRLPK